LNQAMRELAGGVLGISAILAIPSNAPGTGATTSVVPRY
jgi:hypothetical protein